MSVEHPRSEVVMSVEHPRSEVVMSVEHPRSEVVMSWNIHIMRTHRSSLAGAAVWMGPGQSGLVFLRNGHTEPSEQT